MIHYSADRWSFFFAFSLRGSVLPKASAWAAVGSCVAMSINAVVFFHGDAGVKIEGSYLSLFSGFTFILGFLLTTRAKQAYDRWWEGATMLQKIRGEWFNAFSSLMAFCNSSPDKQQEVQIFQHRLVRLMSLLFGSALHQVTTIEEATFDVIELDGFDMESLRFLDHTHDRAEVVLQWVQRLIVEADSLQTVKIAPPILSRVHNQLGNGIVNLRNARKITDFPIPFPLAQMLSLMLGMHWVVITGVCGLALHRISFAGVLTFVLLLSFWSVNYIAIELEMPFGDDPNDLPLHAMQRDFNESLTSLLHPRALQYPSYQMQGTALELSIVRIRFAKCDRHSFRAPEPPAKAGASLTSLSQPFTVETSLTRVNETSTSERGPTSKVAGQMCGKSSTPYTCSGSPETPKLSIGMSGSADSAPRHFEMLEAIPARGDAEPKGTVSSSASGLPPHYSGHTNSSDLGSLDKFLKEHSDLGLDNVIYK